jgi:hypothetical protein
MTIALSFSSVARAVVLRSASHLYVTAAQTIYTLELHLRPYNNIIHHNIIRPAGIGGQPDTYLHPDSAPSQGMPSN